MFDESKYCLGKLCKRGHNYGGTGKSLRYKKNRVCTSCMRIASSLYAKWYPERIRKYSQKRDKKDRDNLSDNYIINDLRQGTTLETGDIPQELVELKRAELKLKRRLKDARKD